ncbi:MAG: hypothetical protein PHP08_01945 [Candidatus Dojkabacteria bacterium]|nr:hypothetical protein [Candidatus Dojkabacteria bacterium]
MDKIDWRKWIVIIAILSILMDIMLHRALGVTLLSISISVVSLYLLFILMPRKKFVLSYLPYFLSIFVFYILLSLLNPLIQNGSFEVLTWGFIIFSIIKSLISAILIWVINIIMDNFRSNKDLLI